MKFILGQKLEMSQVFLPSGEVVPVTKVKAGPCVIVQLKDGKKDNQKALQIGFGEKKEFRLNKPEAGHLKGVDPVRFLKEFAVEKTDGLEKGDLITVESFVSGDIIDVIGVSKGRGFAGVVKRHHFRGGPATHGHKDNLRAPGSIGAGGVQRVFKGMRMGGRMGGDQVTIKNLEIVEVNPQENFLYIKGAVPGGRNGLLILEGKGELKITKKNNQVESKEEISAPEIPAENNA
jgi:large subunit ribosomal protein L3